MLATIAKGLGMARTIDYGNLMHRAMRSLIRSVPLTPHIRMSKLPIGCTRVIPGK